MAQNFLSQIYAKHGIRIDDAFQDSSGSPGLDGQLLLSTATGVLWSDLLTVDETNGFFGINNTAPTAQLDVTGQVNFEDLKLDGELLDQFNSPGTNGMILQSLQLGGGATQGINWVSAGQIVVTGIQQNNNTAFIDVTAAGLGAGYVTGPVTITASLSASGTPASTNFLSGDNTWKQIEIASGNTNTLTVAFTNKNVLTVQTPGVGAATLGLATGKQIYDYIAGLTVNDLSPPTADFDVNNNKILNVTTPTSADDAANKAYVDNVLAGSGALIYQGGYNASTNTPVLDNRGTQIAVTQGWTYTVTVDGTFYGETVKVGDVLIAETDLATGAGALTDWTTVQSNIDVATASTAGAAVIGIAGFNEDDFTAVNGFVSVKDDTYVPYTGATTDVDLGANNLIVDTDTLYVDSTNNRVGIGTTSPAELLYVNASSGDARIGLNAVAGSDTEIKFSNAGTVQYSIGHDDGTDNFVIGTANVDTPKVSITKSGQLIVTGAMPSGGIPLVSLNETSGNSRDGLYLTYTGTTNSAVNVLKISDASKTHLLVSGDGDVGIGTASPVSKLTLEGAKNTNTITLRSTNNDSSWSTGDKYGEINFYSNDSSGAGAGVKASISYEATASSGATNYLSFKTAGTTSGTNNTERMRIDSAGFVGIGSDSPSAILDVAGNQGQAANFAETKTKAGFNLNSSVSTGSNSLTIGELSDSVAYYIQHANSAGTSAYSLALNPYGGNVGIGTTSPTAKLEISNSSGNSFKSSSTTTTGFNASAFYNDNSKGWAQYVYGSAYSGGTYLNVGANGAVQAAINTTGGITTIGAFDLLLGTDSSERMRITSAGGVSFGSSGTAYGTTGQILTSNGNASPTWESSITYGALGPEFTATDSGNLADLDFANYAVFTRTASAGTYYVKSNSGVSTAKPGMVKMLIITGGSSFVLSSGTLIAGSYDGTKTNFIQIAVQASNNYWYSISQQI